MVNGAATVERTPAEIRPVAPAYPAAAPAPAPTVVGAVPPSNGAAISRVISLYAFPTLAVFLKGSSNKPFSSSKFKGLPLYVESALA